MELHIILSWDMNLLIRRVKDLSLKAWINEWMKRGGESPRNQWKKKRLFGTNERKRGG
jgi:hypothetical protein